MAEYPSNDRYFIAWKGYYFCVTCTMEVAIQSARLQTLGKVVVVVEGFSFMPENGGITKEKQVPVEESAWLITSSWRKREERENDQ